MPCLLGRAIAVYGLRIHLGTGNPASIRRVGVSSAPPCQERGESLRPTSRESLPGVQGLVAGSLRHSQPGACRVTGMRRRPGRRRRLSGLLPTLLFCRVGLVWARIRRDNRTSGQCAGALRPPSQLQVGAGPGSFHGPFHTGWPVSSIPNHGPIPEMTARRKDARAS